MTEEKINAILNTYTEEEQTYIRFALAIIEYYPEDHRPIETAEELRAFADECVRRINK